MSSTCVVAEFEMFSDKTQAFEVKDKRKGGTKSNNIVKINFHE